jgi:hypothetical protein
MAGNLFLGAFMLGSKYMDLNQVSYMSTRLVIPNVFFSCAGTQSITSVISSEPDHPRSDGPTRAECARNAGEEESLLNTVWSIGQKMFLAWAISQLGMQ